ncbi:hypothetical protein [Ruminococcus bicirculans (ex Wegman et al. 2014)]|uniref:hypothetical protein n=1 Tax=Ruminococcus TaxID=1263 RepID=UPI00396762DA
MRKPDSKIRKSKNKAKQCLRKISALLFLFHFAKPPFKAQSELVAKQSNMDIQIIIAKNITSQKRK